MRRHPFGQYGFPAFSGRERDGSGLGFFRKRPAGVKHGRPTNDWKFLGRIIITEFIVGKNRTEGTFILVKEFSDQERETITKTYVSDEEVNKILKEIK